MKKKKNAAPTSRRKGMGPKTARAQGRPAADFSGLGVALATPFADDGSLDIDSFKILVDYVLGGDTDFLVALGSTGEAATIDDEERDTVIAACLEAAAGRPVVVGTGHNDTARAAAMTRRAQELGAQGALVVTPYYNKPGTAGLVAHFEACAAAAPGLPIIAYNVPGRTGLNLTPAALARLWENPQVVAVKESSGNLAQIGEIARTLPAGKLLLSGDDNLALATIAVGGAGLVSVVGNLLPAAAKALVDAARAGDLATAQRLNAALLPVIDALFVESNPIPVKAGLEIIGIASGAVRLPLTPAQEATRARLSEALDTARETLS